MNNNTSKYLSSAFIMEGIVDAQNAIDGFSLDVLEDVGVGQIEFVGHAVQYVDTLTLFSSFYDKGIFDYDISHGFGYWFTEQAFLKKSLPSRKRCLRQITELVGQDDSSKAILNNIVEALEGNTDGPLAQFIAESH